VIARALVRDGFGNAEARRLSTLSVASIEGALILARVEHSAAPIDDVAKSLAAALQVKAPARKRVAK
jgi:TetR/AcrR family transcriptional repressor of lmrAB and yxaGH operons